MINKVTITNHLGESIECELRFPEKSGFLILDIDGLGPGKADINSTEVLSSDGSFVNSARVNSRNIVFDIVFDERFGPIEDIRQKTYKFFPIKRAVTMVFESDNRVSMTYGYVESNEPTFFSKRVGTKISIFSPEAYLFSTTKNLTIFAGSEPFFEFPFSNESLVSNLIVMGKIEPVSERSVYYTGDSSVGMVITIHALGPATNIKISNTGTRESMSINTTRLAALTGQGISAGDDLIISTIRGSKEVTLQRNGLFYNVLNCLDKNPSWFQLERGDNVFAYTADTGASNLQFKIENLVVFEGA